MKFLTLNKLNENLRDFFNTIVKPYVENKIKSLKEKNTNS